MKKRLFLLCVSLILLGTVLLLPVFADSYQIEIVNATYYQTEARTLLDKVNDFRTGPDAYYVNQSGQRVDCSGLSRVTWDYQLEKIAMQRAAELSIQFNHYRPNGTHCSDVDYDFNTAFPASSVGENIAGGNYLMSGEEAFILWREDGENYWGQGHRRVMLNSSMKAMAAAHAFINGKSWWVMVTSYARSYDPYFAPENGTKQVLVEKKITLNILENPEDTTVNAGSTAKFEIVATGASSYQWQWKSPSSATWENCTSSTTGYTSSILEPVATTARNGYQYRCVICNDLGKLLYSNPATLTVKRESLTLTTQPASQDVREGSSAFFYVVASGASSYQWQWRADSSGTWANCSSATTGYNTATLKPVGTAARDGYQYRCIIKDSAGNSITSDAATLTVLTGVIFVDVQPVSQTVAEGSSAAFKVTASSVSSYQWQWRSSSSGTWANCSSATAGYNTATLKPVGTAARNGYQYRCVMKNRISTAFSNTVTLTVKSGSLSITTQPASQTVASGSAASFKVTASGASSYQWQWRASSSGTWANCSSATAGYNAATLKPVGTAARNGYQYRCVVKGASGSVTSSTVTLKVLAITTQPVSQSVSLNASASFKVTALNAASYQWQWRSSSSGTWANCSSATTGYNAATLKPVGTAARNGYQYRCVIKDSAGHSVTSNTVTLTVKSSGPSITGQPVSQTVSKDSYASFTVTASGSGLSYQWQWRSSSSGTWANCSSATAGYNRATLNPMGTAARNGYQYRCIVKNSSGGSTTSNTVTLTVK